MVKLQRGQDHERTSRKRPELPYASRRTGATGASSTSEGRSWQVRVDGGGAGDLARRRLRVVGAEEAKAKLGADDAPARGKEL